MKALALGLAAVCFLAAALYATGVLQLGAHESGVHIKHAVLFAILGVLALVWLRFQGAKTSGASLR